jgi:threonine dehydrogenase-like Zn-dependent dehydrogenase
MNPIMNAKDASLGTRTTEVPAQPLLDRKRPMHAMVWRGKNDVRYEEVPRPLLTHPKDILLQVTASSICGSDLHLFQGNVPTMHSGDILGHEFMGRVLEVGADVQKVKVGERVVVAFDIGCGQCKACKRKEFSTCLVTNPSRLQKEQYGGNTSAVFGYSHLTGGVPGGQAEFVRVPYADTNCLVLPDKIPDDVGLFLSDIIPTAYFGTELAEVQPGDNVAIWGLGPVGLLAARWAQIKGAARVVGIDNVEDRLSLARRELQIDIINFKEQNTIEALKGMFGEDLDCAIECAGFDYPTTLKHKAEMALGMETDTADILTEMITAVRPRGRIGILGVYVGTCNHFPIGALMEKGLSVRAGQCPTQRYWDVCLDHIQRGTFDPRFVVTTRGKLSEGPRLFSEFNNKEKGVVKVFLRPDTITGSSMIATGK